MYKAQKMEVDKVRLNLASPEIIRSWSYGEVKTQETINYRTLRPEKDGLFCERIFGTTKDWECQCGKFRSNRYRGVVCDRCGVEVTHSRVRRERMGSIELVSPVAHVWYYRSVPSKLGDLLGVSGSELRSVLMYNSYIVVDPGDSDLKALQIIDKKDYESLTATNVSFSAGKGAEVIKTILQQMNLEELITQLRHEMQNKSTKVTPNLLRRIEIAEHFRASDNEASWMILDAIPVIPPELRPMVQLEGGRFASSDLNDLYRRVIRINDRVRKMISIRAPLIMIENEKRMLQQAVDSLFDNTKDSSFNVSGSKQVKCLSDMLRGKQGRFRQNLLGKRVDYSGRSVVVVGPDLKLHQCGIPVKMALELFKPFIERKLIEKGIVFNVKRARILIEQDAEEVYEVLDEVVKEHPVLLNRAPTLHRLGFQAFEPVLVEGKAIRLHPLVCYEYNADFDGDQMAVHIPLSQAAIAESWGLMLSARNLLNPANGEPVVFPSQDMILGIYYLTTIKKKEPGTGKRYSSKRQLEYALETTDLSLQAEIEYKLEGKYIKTTPGRVIFNEAIPEAIGFKNQSFNDEQLKQFIFEVHNQYGPVVLVKMLDALKNLGFKYSTLFGSTIGVADMHIPQSKKQLTDNAQKSVQEIQGQYQRGAMTNEERYNRIIEVWSKTNDELTDNLMDELKESDDGFNAIYLMAVSGARGSRNQIRQLAGMRGLMAKPSGDIIELPIRSNFKEGLSVLEFFISTNGARKGLADTALKTADAGYLTRRLVDAAQNVVVTQEDCGTINGIEISALKDGEDIVEGLAERIKGRYTLERVVRPITGEILVDINQEINEETARTIEENGIEKVMIRSVLTCEAKRGVCQKCYGYNLATNKAVEIGEAVGVVAAQSIGQPGTQLTMRTFHIGGVATRETEESQIVLDYPMYIHSISGSHVVLSKEKILMTRKGFLIVSKVLEDFERSNFKSISVKHGQKISSETMIGKNKKDEKVSFDKPSIVHLTEEKVLMLSINQEIRLRNGTELSVRPGQLVPANTRIGEFDLFSEPIISEYDGIVKYEDILPGTSMKEESNEDTGKIEKKIVEGGSSSLNPSLKIYDGEELLFSYSLPFGSYLNVDNEQVVGKGQVIAKMPKESVKTRDITGGLPKISKLFEAFNPGESSAVLSLVDGKVSEIINKDRGKTIIIFDEFEKSFSHSVPLGRHLLVREGDTVRAGEQLCDGEINPHDILSILGVNELQSFLINEIQEVYRLQGVTINDKHIGIIIRQMMKNLEVVQSGDTSFINGQLVDRNKFHEENEKITEQGGLPAIARPCLLGVKKASVNVESFLSAASFQETTKVLTNKAIEGAVDVLAGLKENLIMGQLIPAGTGMRKNKRVILFDDESKNLDDKVKKIIEAREREKEEVRQSLQLKEANEMAE